MASFNRARSSREKTRKGLPPAKKQIADIQSQPYQTAFYACVAEKMLPVTLATAGSQGTDWALGKILKRVGLAGVEKAGPIAVAGTAVGAVIGCAKPTASGGSH